MTTSLKKANKRKVVWLVNPYGPIEGENWRDYSFNQFGKYLSQNDFDVVWWTASFSHHFKKQRSSTWKDIIVNDNFIIRLVPTPSYTNNFGFGRLRKDFVFGNKAYKRFKNSQKPDVIIASENPLTLGKPSFKYAKKNNVPIIYDQMDIWPEFIVKSLRFPLNVIARILFLPAIIKRKHIYNSISGSIALGKNYLEFMHRISPSLRKKPSALVYNGIDVNDFRSRLKNGYNSKLIPTKKQGEIWLIFAGTLGPSYDIEGIIRVSRRLEMEGFNQYKFIIAGSGPFETSVLDAAHKQNNILYVGKLLPSELIPIYGVCDIGLATYSKGSNVDMCDKFYDYTAAGLAIINSLTGEVSEYVKKERIGYNYIANDDESLYETICKFDSFDSLKQMQERSFKIGYKFDKNIQNEKLKSVICLVIDGGI